MERTVDLGAYLKSLCRDIAAFQEMRTPNVRLTCEAASVHVGFETATSVGVVVNELVSNSYEHAFSGKGGNIAVTLDPPKKGCALLAIRDDGMGLLKPISGSTGLGLANE